MAPIAQPDTVEVRFAETDQDVVAIHRFLCAMAGPLLPGPIDPKDSIEEVWRVCSDDVALMAVKDGHLVGSIGLIRPKMWWGKFFILANRWFFALPGAGKPLLQEAIAIAKASELELHIIDETKSRLKIFNRSPKRPKAAS